MTTSLQTLVSLREPFVNEYVSSFSPRRGRYVSDSSKIFCDPVHGQISLHPVCTAIVDTPQFQRLRHIKQTGFTEFVYHGSSHNRFGHSLGVCHLAGKFLQELKERQPELHLTDTDILCVELAGLCHDLGHGPYSHTWEVFMNNASKKRNWKKKWKHEIMSANMLDYLIEENDLYPVLEKYGIGPQEITQVKDYILGKKPKDSGKAYLYQIINNDDSGLDVDKFDYFLRDSLHLGLPCSFDYERLMQYAKVFNVDGRAQICFRDKTIESVYNVFRTRSNLHRLAYQHKVTIMIERMFLDAIEKADDEIIGLNGEKLHFWEWSIAAAFSHGDALRSALKTFCMLTDEFVFACLKYTSNPDLKPSSDLIKALDKRSCKSKGFYQHIGMKILLQKYNEEEILKGICSFLPHAHEVIQSGSPKQYRDANPVSPSDVCVYVVPVNWGKGSQNPVDFVHFYSKDDCSMRRCTGHLDVSVMLPKTFEEIQVHVLCRRSDEFAVDVVYFCYDLYWKCANSKTNGHA